MTAEMRRARGDVDRPRRREAVRAADRVAHAGQRDAALDEGDVDRAEPACSRSDRRSTCRSQLTTTALVPAMRATNLNLQQVAREKLHVILLMGGREQSAERSLRVEQHFRNCGVISGRILIDSVARQRAQRQTARKGIDVIAGCGATAADLEVEAGAELDEEIAARPSRRRCTGRSRWRRRRGERAPPAETTPYWWRPTRPRRRATSAFGRASPRCARGRGCSGVGRRKVPSTCAPAAKPAIVGKDERRRRAAAERATGRRRRAPAGEHDRRGGEDAERETAPPYPPPRSAPHSASRRSKNRRSGSLRASSRARR